MTLQALGVLVADFLGGYVIELLNEQVLHQWLRKSCIDTVNDRFLDIIELDFLNVLNVRIMPVELAKNLVIDEIRYRNL